jgi:hypothetical protein
MEQIKHTCSLGHFCHSSQILKQNNLKNYSYPFDWVFSNCENIIHCLKDDFNIFLDKSYYIRIDYSKCGHSHYNDKMWWHHNPLDNENDYNYYVRCVKRFKQLLKCEDRKLFIMMFVNLDNIEETLKQQIIEFNEDFSKHTKNYTLLVICNIHNKQNNYHEFKHNGNIDFLELHTLSTSSGLAFANNNDNVYLNNIIKKTYNFNIIENPDFI